MCSASIFDPKCVRNPTFVANSCHRSVDRYIVGNGLFSTDPQDSRAERTINMESSILNAGQDVLLYALTMIAALAILFSQLDESVTASRRKSGDSGNLNGLDAAGDLPLHDSTPRPC